MNNEDEYVIAPRAAKILGISRNTLRQYAVDGKMPFKLVHNGGLGTRVYAIKDLENFQQLKLKQKEL
jgi:DNA-binding transcriptional MerR regulator